jgi:LSD1 subclass zinc finger protein
MNATAQPAEQTQTTSDGQGPKQQAKVKTFPCKSCGARLSFAPGTKTLKCEYCGAANDIPKDETEIEELDFEIYLKAIAGKQEQQEKVHVKCTNCGSEQDLPPNTFAGNCAFCATPIVAKGYANRLIKPKSLIPFRVPKNKAQEEFKKWMSGLWLAPSELKSYAKGDGGLKGMYLPYWTYDCSTFSEYTGERGKDYTVTREGSDGKTYTETRTDWTRVSGEVENVFDDVLVSASPTLKKLEFSFFGGDRFTAWNTKALVPYSEEFVTGFQAEAYQLGLSEGYKIAKGIIDERILVSIKQDIGGDRQQVHSVSTQYSDITFKHVLVPVWISAYRYRDKVYRFMVNGQNGAVQGESPKSAWKIFFLVMGILLVLFIFLMLVGKK